MKIKNSEFFIDDTISIKFDKGKFDNFCVYITNYENKIPIKKIAPKDKEYFEDLLNLKKNYGKIIYDLFVKIYQKSNKELNLSLAKKIIYFCDKHFITGNKLSKKTFLVLYYSMVAEENKSNTKLGKKIKRLGVHQILIENQNPSFAANYSKGMKWHEIEKECKNRGF